MTCAPLSEGPRGPAASGAVPLAVPRAKSRGTQHQLDSSLAKDSRRHQWKFFAFILSPSFCCELLFNFLSDRVRRMRDYGPICLHVLPLIIWSLWKIEVYESRKEARKGKRKFFKLWKCDGQSPYVYMCMRIYMLYMCVYIIHVYLALYILHLVELNLA